MKIKKSEYKKRNPYQGKNKNSCKRGARGKGQRQECLYSRLHPRSKKCGSFQKMTNRGTAYKKAVERSKNCTAQKKNQQQPGYGFLADIHGYMNNTRSYVRNGIWDQYSGDKSGIQYTYWKGAKAPKETASSIKTKESTVKAAGMVVTDIVTRQIDGGEEIKDSLLAADMVVSPIMTSAENGADYFRKKQASLAGRKAKIKADDNSEGSGGSDYFATGNSVSSKGGELKNKELLKDREFIKNKGFHKKEEVLKKREILKEKDIQKKDTLLKKEKGKKSFHKKGVPKENGDPVYKKNVMKQVMIKQGRDIDHNSIRTGGKINTKNSRNILNSKTIKSRRRNLMIASFLNRMKQEENQASVGKAIKDTVFIKAGILIKQMIALCWYW